MGIDGFGSRKPPHNYFSKRNIRDGVRLFTSPLWDALPVSEGLKQLLGGGAVGKICHGRRAAFILY